MDILASLTAFGSRVGLKPALREKKYAKVWCLEISTGALSARKNAVFRIPQPVARGVDAANVPNRTYDLVKHVVAVRRGVSSPFWVLTQTIVKRSEPLTQAVEAFLANPKWEYKTGSLTDGVGVRHLDLDPDSTVVLTFKDAPLAEHPVVAAWLSTQSNPDADGPSKACLITGKQRPLSRLHLGIRSGTDKLVSHNEDSTKYVTRGLRLEPNECFPVSVEAAALYSSGLYNLLDLRRDPISAMGVAKDVSLVLWPHQEGTSHPIIPAVITIIRMLPAGGSKPQQQKADQELLAAAWQVIDSTDGSDPTDLCMAILGIRKIRYIPFAYGHTTVGNLRAALIQFRKEFEGSTFRQLSGTWLNSQGACKDDVLYSVLWAVLTGKPYPMKVTWLTGYEVTEHTKLRWSNAYNHRKKGTPLMSFNKDLQDFSSPPTRERYYDSNLWSTQNKFYLLGQLVDVFCRLRAYAQHQNAVSWAVELKNAATNPQRAYFRTCERGGFHIAKLRKKGRKLEWEIEFQRIISDYDKGGIGSLPARLTTEERGLVALGAMNQKAYAEHLLAHWSFLKLQKNPKPTVEVGAEEDEQDAAE